MVNVRMKFKSARKDGMMDVCYTKRGSLSGTALPELSEWWVEKVLNKTFKLVSGGTSIGLGRVRSSISINGK